MSSVSVVKRAFRYRFYPSAAQEVELLRTFGKLTLRHREQHEALERARAEQATDAWKQGYAVRAGIEGTVHQAVTATGVRRSRYLGLPKTHLAHVFAATALNLIRLDAWWAGTPLGTTRTSHFADLDFELAA